MNTIILARPLGIEKERHIEALDRWNPKPKAEKIVCPVCGTSIQDDDREVFSEKAMCFACDSALDIGD
jgi:formylmethanofuran dehydrogenase subunit E